jgi:uncharacterized membrane protein|tara:strand:- start:1712 stop:1942 length:231 start_codon:yes stop_codon:yes gene_type:complete
MEQYIFYALFISAVYILIKFIEMKVILKEFKPLKDVIRDTIVVFISVIIGMFLYSQVSGTINIKGSPTAFIGAADF